MKYLHDVPWLPGKLMRTARFAAALAFLGLAPLLAAPGGGGEETTNATSSSPPDDVVSLPFTAEEPSGLTFIGAPAEIRALVHDLQGRGQIFVERLRDGELLATLQGDYRVILDRSLLAQGDVRILFRAGSRFSEGRAHLELWGGNESFFPAETLELPLARLAAARQVQGTGLELSVRAPDAERYHAFADFGRRQVTLIQIDGTRLR